MVNVVAGRGDTVGAPLTAHPGVRMISLTGSIATGQKVLQAASRNIKRTHLELGGKAPVLVFDDADLEAVVAGVRMAGFYNAGQDCTAACRVYAGPRIHDRLVADLGAAVGSLRAARPRGGHRARPPDQRRASASGSRASWSARSPPARRGGDRRRRRRGTGFFYAPTCSPGRSRPTRSPGGRSSARHLRHAGLRRRAGHRVGQRLRLRPGRLGLDRRRARGHARGEPAPVRLRLGQPHFTLVNEMPTAG